MAQILVVDDSVAVRDDVSQFFKDNGFTVTVAVDGIDGLEKLKADPSIKLIFADIHMPNMDGLSMVEKIRHELGNTSVNVLMLTTENDARMKTRGKQAGVKGWIIKPFTGANVLQAVKTLIP